MLQSLFCCYELQHVYSEAKKEQLITLLLFVRVGQLTVFDVRNFPWSSK